jgi:sugar phosphate isomerase/epimerase
MKNERSYVAQICNLLYRRIAFCGARTGSTHQQVSSTLPIPNRRYGRLQICATTLAAILACMTSLPATAQPKVAPAKTYPFFPFCIDWHDAKKRNPEQQATMLKELGYEGVGHIWLQNIPERLRTLDAAGLKLFQITMSVDITPGKQAYDPQLKEIMPLLKGRGVQFLLLMNGMKPSDPAGDARAVEIVREISNLATTAGAQVLLYPHSNMWMEREEDCVRVADKVDRPNVGVMFNLCHWLRVSKDRNYEPLLAKAMPRLWSVSINGADDFDPKDGWSHYIQPLGRGSFDVYAMLETLKRSGFNGPIGLQCYGIPGDVRDHLAESLGVWRDYALRLQGN